MTTLPYFSVIIAGAGPTGLAMGNLLGMYGIDALVLEQHAGLSDCSKAISIDDEGLRVCQAMGLHHAVVEHLLYDVEARYLSGTRQLARIAPTAHRNGFPLISTFLQPDLEAILHNGLKRFPCISLQFQHTIESFEQTNDSVVLSVTTPGGRQQRYECAYLLACDGGKSTIRRALEIAMRGSTYAQKWLVIDSIHDPDPSSIITFYCNPRRPAVTVPAPQQARRWEFMLLPGEQEADLLRDERARDLIHSVGGHDNPRITRKVIYTFHALLASTFSRGRVFLLGDAAHLMPPFGGQGMNCGLRDAHNLGWKLQLVLQGLAAPALLDSYTVERRAHTAQMLNLSKFLGRFVMTTSRPLAVIRDGVLRAIMTIPVTRDYLSEMRIKPQPRYARGFFLSSSKGTRAHKQLAGMMLPQPEITTAGGNKALLDSVLGSGFALLRQHPDEQQAFSCLHSPFWQHLGIRFAAIRPGESADNLPWHDPSLFVLVRPDRYMYGAFKEEEEESFVAGLRQM